MCVSTSECVCTGECVQVCAHMCVCTGECVQVCAHECVGVGVCADAFPPCRVEVTAEKVISQGPSLSDPSCHPRPFVLNLRAGPWGGGASGRVCAQAGEAGGPLAASVLRQGGLAGPQAVGRGVPPQSGADMGPEGKQRTSPSSSTAVPVEVG